MSCRMVGLVHLSFRLFGFLQRIAADGKYSVERWENTRESEGGVAGDPRALMRDDQRAPRR